MASRGLPPLDAEDEAPWFVFDAAGRTVAVPSGVTAVPVRDTLGVPTAGAEGVPTLRPPDVVPAGVRQVMSASRLERARVN